MILVFTHKVSNSLHYVLKEIFVNQWNLNFEITQDKNHYLQASANIKIHYTEENIFDFEGHWIPNSNFLFTPDFSQINTQNDMPIGIISYPKNEIIDNAYQKICEILTIENDLKMGSEEFSFRKVYFPMPSTIGFDVFAHAFALMANVEEVLMQYTGGQKDKHGRFDTKQLKFVQQNMHLLPMADIAINRLQEYLNIKVERNNTFQIVPTADIDQCFQFQGKSIVKFIGGGFKHPSTLKDRIKYVFNKQDKFAPSKTLSTILGNHANSKIFWLCNAKETNKNKQISRENSNLHHEINESKTYANLGIHPSYQNELCYEIYKEELNWLENIAQLKIENSRQHYLHFKLPQTYTDLESLGIKHDWSMGFSQTIGFRNGSTIPRKWFNILDNSEHSLTIHSFSLMDVTCKNYLKLNSLHTNILSNSIKQIVKSINGNFCFVIHNESLSETDGWEGWRETFNTWASNI